MERTYIELIATNLGLSFNATDSNEMILSAIAEATRPVAMEFMALPTNGQTLSERICAIADKLKSETSTQIKLTSRIMGDAAQIIENQAAIIQELMAD